ncbi:MAG: hypothetical protein ABWW69_01405 [Pyrodictiaceae archaeon]
MSETMAQQASNVSAAGNALEAFQDLSERKEALIDIIIEAYWLLDNLGFSDLVLQEEIAEDLMEWASTMHYDRIEELIWYAVGKRHGFFKILRELGPETINAFMEEIKACVGISCLSTCREICKFLECYNDVVDYCNLLASNGDDYGLRGLMALLIALPPYD